VIDTAPSSQLLELARRCGVGTDYTDWLGAYRQVDAETIVRVLAALDVDASTPEAADRALAALDDAEWRRVLPPCTVARAGWTPWIPVNVPHGATVRAEIELEDGSIRELAQVDNWVEPRHIDGALIGRATFEAPGDLPTGWHRIHVHVDAGHPVFDSAEGVGEDAVRAAAGVLELAPDDLVDGGAAGAASAVSETRGDDGARADATEQDAGDAAVGAPLRRRRHAIVAEAAPAAHSTTSAALIVTPASIDAAPGIDGDVWGVMAQSYQLRSAASWGLGDANDVARLAEWTARQGGDFVLLNPLHAPDPVVPVEPSPYLPTTRRFLDPSVIRVQDVPGFALLGADDLASVTRFADRAGHQNVLDHIDRDTAWTARHDALRLVHAVDLGDVERRAAFGGFCEREGQGLVDFATYCALAREHGADWRIWPEELRDAGGKGVARLREEHAAEVDFWRWVQFVAAEQLGAAHARAVDAGLRLGLVHDLAVGVQAGGADTWALSSAFAHGVSVGAPPDQFNQLGQNWGQPPLRPDRLRELGFAPFRDMLRGVLRAAGGIRVDHILGLFRLWWVPEGHTADRGTYVYADAEALVGILALEAERAGALVVGEDLGVVADNVRSTLRERGLNGTSILWFEWGSDGRPLLPGDYREQCLATVTTHDLPPSAGYLELAHVALRERLGLLTQSVDAERERELGVIGAVVARLRETGFLAEDAGHDVISEADAIVIALHRYLASGASRLFGVSVADLAGDRRSINQPGTHREYPNWSLPLTDADGRVVSLEALLSSPWASELAVASRRPGSSR